MILPCHRAITLVLIIFCLAMFTGIATTVSALERPEAVDACCDRGEHEREPLEGPCTDASCLCFSCLTLGLDTLLPLDRPLLSATSGYRQAPAFGPDGFTAGIDYPPETA